MATFSMSDRRNQTKQTRAADSSGGHEGVAKSRIAKSKPQGKPERALRRDERRQIMANAKATWEEMRPKATDATKTAKLVTKLCGLLGGRIAEFVFRHDGSRIVQWMLKDGSEKQKCAIMEELLLAKVDSVPVVGDSDTTSSFFVRLACDRYGRHLAMKLLRVSKKEHKVAIFNNYLRGNTAVLIRNSYGADLLDYAFQTTLNVRQRAHLVVELLFSREKELFSHVLAKSAGALQPSQEGHDREKLTFPASLRLIDHSFRDVAVESAGLVLSTLIDKDAIVRLGIVHAALEEYLNALIEDYPAEKSRELCSQLAPVLVHLGHTKAGATCSVNCIKILDAKHRKKVVRSIRGHVRSLATEEYGHRLLLAMLEWIDDTKMVGRAITTELFSTSKIAAEISLQADEEDEQDAQPRAKTSTDKPKTKTKSSEKRSKSVHNSEDANSMAIDVDYLESMCLHKHGRMLIISLLFPRDTRYFNPDIYSHVWTPMDESKFGQTSKKSNESRRTEHLQQFTRALGLVIERSFRKLVLSHWSAPVLLGCLHEPDLCEKTTSSAVAVLRRMVEGEGDPEMASNLCARKTIGTMIKLGGSMFRETLVRDLSNIASSKCRDIDQWECLSHLVGRSDSSVLERERSSTEGNGGDSLPAGSMPIKRKNKKDETTNFKETKKQKQ